MKNKNKTIARVAGIWGAAFLFFGLFSVDVRTAEAVSACVQQNPTGWACMDTSLEYLIGPLYKTVEEWEKGSPREVKQYSQCKKGLCPGSKDVICCPYMIDGKFNLLGPIDRETDEQCYDVSIQLCTEDAANPMDKTYYKKPYDCFDTEMYWRCGVLAGPMLDRGCEHFGGKMQLDENGRFHVCSLETSEEASGAGTGGASPGQTSSQGESPASSAGGTAGANTGTGSAGGSAAGASVGMSAMPVTTIITNPLKYDTVEGFLGNFLAVLQKIIVLLSMVFIVIGAVMYIISAGGGMVETAKKTITASMIGLALGLAAPSFLKEISLILGWTKDLGPAAEAMTISQIALNVLNFLLGAVGILAIVMMVIGGSMYLTSAGNENQIDKGKDIVKASIIGIIISLSAMILVRQIARFFM